jgi:orotidine-5'-phosphate decarboxylase
MDQQTLAEIGIAGSIEQTVLRLAGLAKDSGLDGVVCSALETAPLRRALGADFCLVTPGIRPADASVDDQSRIATPADALRNGSSYLVIGRAITQATDPLQALQRISASIQNFS